MIITGLLFILLNACSIHSYNPETGGGTIYGIVKLQYSIPPTDRNPAIVIKKESWGGIMYLGKKEYGYGFGYIEDTKVYVYDLAADVFVEY